MDAYGLLGFLNDILLKSIQFDDNLRPTSVHIV